MSAVDNIYRDFQDVAEILRQKDEFSLQISIENNLQKTLLLSAASYFEHNLTKEVEDFVSKMSSGNSMIVSLVRAKAISRQYHTWFDWNSNNANNFFSLFGQKFKEHMKKIIDADAKLDMSIKDFMEIGRYRNLLVHSNYASYSIDKTPNEIHMQYLSAQVFVNVVGIELGKCAEIILNDLKNTAKE